jgi:CDP-paratose 2-epimerase
MKREGTDTAARGAPTLGVNQWFHYQDYASVEQCVELLLDLEVRHLRTGVSWADYCRPEGKAWYDWQMRQLAQFNVLLSVWHTPPSISEGGDCASPPRRLKDFADFIDLLINDYGDTFETLELWNEPNNRLKWAFDRFDPKWEKFGSMIGMAGYWARRLGKPTVLGGMVPVDPHWLNLMHQYGTLDVIDIVGIHGFPEMWWVDAPNLDWFQHWKGWENKVEIIRDHCAHRRIWITETGLATWEMSKRKPGRYDLQCLKLREAAAAPVERVYWYSLVDLSPEREAIEGFHVDENEYHLGLVTYDGMKKPSYFTMKELMQNARAKTAASA